MSTTTGTGIRGTAIGLRVVLVATLIGGCATRPAPEYGGRWKPVNRYAETPREIPLHQSYTFLASPMDGTLKAMLERWARDSKMTLSYEHSYDFTLYSAVARIRTDNLQDAASQLSVAYAAQGIVVTTEGNQIVVRGVVSSAAGTSTQESGATAMP